MDARYIGYDELANDSITTDTHADKDSQERNDHERAQEGDEAQAPADAVEELSTYSRKCANIECCEQRDQQKYGESLRVCERLGHQRGSTPEPQQRSNSPARDNQQQNRS